MPAAAVSHATMDFVIAQLVKNWSYGLIEIKLPICGRSFMLRWMHMGSLCSDCEF